MGARQPAIAEHQGLAGWRGVNGRELRIGALKTLDQPSIKQQIVRRIEMLRPDHNPRWGKMNARQMVSHLNDSFRCVMGEMRVSILPNYRFRWFIKWCALYIPMPWPHGVSAPPEIDQEIGGTMPADFDEDRQALLALIDRFTHQPRDFAFGPHPLFLEMTEWQWMRWGYLHTDHHLRQFGV